MITRFLGLLGLIGSLAVTLLLEGDPDSVGALRLLHWPAIILTSVGPVSLVFCSFDFDIILRTMGLVLGNSPSNRLVKREKEANFLHRLGTHYYDQGALVFEKVQTRGLSKFVNNIVERLSLRMPLPDVRELAELDRVRYEAELVQCLNVVCFGTRLTPSIGMLGTILGMVRLLASLQDPSQLGAHISLALLTTFYGLFFSLVVWTPIQQKLERVLDIEVEGCNQALRWLELVEKRKPSDYFEDAMKGRPEEKRAS